MSFSRADRASHGASPSMGSADKGRLVTVSPKIRSRL